MQGMGGTAHIEGNNLELTLNGSQGHVVFARRGEQLVVIVDEGGIGPIDGASPGRLKENESLITLLGDMKPVTTAWSVSTRDMTQVPLGISSRGYVMESRGPGQRMEFRFVFTDAAQARRASDAAGPFLEEAETFLGISLRSQVHGDEDTLVVSLDLTEMSTLEPAKMQALQERLEALAASR